MSCKDSDFGGDMKVPELPEDVMKSISILRGKDQYLV